MNEFRSRTRQVQKSIAKRSVKPCKAKGVITSINQDEKPRSKKTSNRKKIENKISIKKSHSEKCPVNKRPEPKKIGIIGLGLVGKMIVQKLLKDRQNLYIWNRTYSKCKEFVDQGAIMALSPAEVVKKCDITFCCVTDSDAVRAIVFGEGGILKDFKPCQIGTKGFVKMTSSYGETSVEIAGAIENSGMKYIEAHIMGSSKTEPPLISMSGDRQLFDEWEACFQAIFLSAFYLSSDVGKNQNMNMISSMFVDLIHGGLVDAYAQSKGIHLPPKDILKFIE